MLCNYAMADDSYTLKEMVQELRETAKDQVIHVARISSVLEGIEKHLAQLNSKVAAHERLHQEHVQFRTKATVIVSIAVFFAVTFVNRVIAYIGL